MSPVRLIGPEGEQIGIVPTSEALQRAQDYGLDLVEVSPKSRPPVCRILDFGKYKYELSKKDRIARKKQHSFQLKEMRYRPRIDNHDFTFKTNHVRGFVESGNKVKVFVMFRGREMAHTESGRKLLERVAEELEDVATVEMKPRLEGRHMNMIIAPSVDVMKKLRKKTDKSKAKKHKEKSPTVVEEEKNQTVDSD